MTQYSNQGFYTQGGGVAVYDNALIGTIPAGACLTHIDVQGFLMGETGSFAAPETGAVEVYNTMTALQWVYHSASPADLNTTNPTGGNWLARANAQKAVQEQVPLIESTEYTYLEAIWVSFRWRGQFYVPEEIDVYVSFGADATRAAVPEQKMFVDYNVVWAEYP